MKKAKQKEQHKKHKHQKAKKDSKPAKNTKTKSNGTKTKDPEIILSKASKETSNAVMLKVSAEMPIRDMNLRSKKDSREDDFKVEIETSEWHTKRGTTNEPTCTRLGATRMELSCAPNCETNSDPKAKKRRAGEVFKRGFERDVQRTERENGRH